MTKPFIIYSVLIFIQIMFGMNFSASKIIVTQMDPILWSNLRFLLAGVGMLIVTLAFRRKHPKVDKFFLKAIIPLSLLGMALGQGLFLIGLRHTTSINSAILITLIPILTLVIVVVRQQEHLSTNKIIGFGLSFLGVIFMKDLTSFTLANNTLLGDGLVFLGALCFALYLSYGKAFFMKYDNMWSTTYMFLISGIFMSLFNIPKLLAFELPQLDSVFISCAIFSILGATLLTYLLNNWALKRASSGNIALFIYLQPLVAGILGYFFLKEVITIRMLVCFCLIFLGVIVSLSRRDNPNL